MSFPKYRRRAASKPRRSKASSTGVSKAKARPKAPARIKPVDDGNRTLSAWLVKDDKLILAALGIGKCTLPTGRLVELAQALARDPLSVLRRIDEPEIADRLEAKGLAMPEDLDEEERLEFWGLTLSGVPMRAALAWCRGADDRLDAASLALAMTGPDLRPALRLIPQLGLMVSSADQIEALGFLASQPVEAVRRAVDQVLDRFDVPTPPLVSQALFGAAPENIRAYDWAPARESLETLAQALKASMSTPSATSSYAKPRRGASKKSSGRRRSTRRSPSVSAGSSSRVDTRTAAEKAWELRTTW